MNERLHYGTWIRRKKIFTFWTLSAVFFLTTALAIITPWLLLPLVPAFIFVYIAVIVTFTQWRFSPRGG
ncbi:MAG TPA: hypothetical protein VMW69_07580, partial [Spirochaetia bacterium]|nr:hypothetical protein [Spirochaetia bacterium]